MVFEDDPTITDLWLHNNRVLMAVDSIRGTDLFKTYRARRDSCVPNFCGGKEELTDVWTPSGIGRLSTWHFRQGEDTLNASHQCAIDNTLVPILEQLEGVEIHIRFAELKDWTDAMKSLPMERALAVRAHLLEGVDAPERILLKPIHSDELIFINYAPLEYQLQSVFCELRWQTSGR